MPYQAICNSYLEYALGYCLQKWWQVRYSKASTKCVHLYVKKKQVKGKHQQTSPMWSRWQHWALSKIHGMQDLFVCSSFLTEESKLAQNEYISVFSDHSPRGASATGAAILLAVLNLHPVSLY